MSVVTQLVNQLFSVMGAESASETVATVPSMLVHGDRSAVPKPATGSGNVPLKGDVLKIRPMDHQVVRDTDEIDHGPYRVTRTGFSANAVKAPLLRVGEGARELSRHGKDQLSSQSASNTDDQETAKVPEETKEDAAEETHPSEDRNDRQENIKDQEETESECECSRKGEHFEQEVASFTIPGTLEQIYNLLYTSDFGRQFLEDEQKVQDMTVVSDWHPSDSNPDNLEREISYIKPLSSSVGPKSTKCEIHSKIEHRDFDDYITVVTTTRTPDVPSGKSFRVRTRTCITKAGEAQTRLLFTVQLDWSGKSFIKGVIERSCIDGERTYCKQLESAMREHIEQHKDGFGVS